MSLSRNLIIGIASILAVQIITIESQDVDIWIPPPQNCCRYCLESALVHSSSGVCCECVNEITIPCDPRYDTRPIDGDERCNQILADKFPEKVDCPAKCCLYCVATKVTNSTSGVCCECVETRTIPCDYDVPAIEGDPLCIKYISGIYPQEANCLIRK